MKALRLVVGVLVGGAIAFASTRSAHGGGSGWLIFSPFTLPGVLIAAPSGFRADIEMGVSQLRNANLLIIDGVDFVFYSVLFCWLLSRWSVSRE